MAYNPYERKREETKAQWYKRIKDTMIMCVEKGDIRTGSDGHAYIEIPQDLLEIIDREVGGIKEKALRIEEIP